MEVEEMIQRSILEAAEGFKQRVDMIRQQGAKRKDSEGTRTKIEEERKHGLGQEVEDGGIYFNFCCAFSLEFQKNFNIQCMHISNKPYAFLEARNYSSVTEKHQLLNSMEDDGGREGIF